jgi:hypothetical protein
VLKHSIYTLVGLIFLTTLNIYGYDTFADSPSFHFKQITDNRSDWINMTSTKSGSGLRSTDILAVTYFSDGEILNGSVWLYFPFDAEPRSQDKVNYGMLIDADFDKKTGFDGIDYQLEVGWNGTDNSWTKSLEEWSPLGNTRTIDIENNYSGFFEPEKNYMVISLNLSQINNPSKYKVTFYAESVENVTSLTDFTRWVAVPPLELSLSTTPNSVQLRKDEETTIEVRINTTQGYEPVIKLDTKSQSKYIEAYFDQRDTIRIPSYGVATIPMTIKSTPDALIGPYTLFIIANSTFPPEEVVTPMLAENDSTSLPIPRSVIPQDIITQSSLLVTLQEPSNILDFIDSLWDRIGGFLAFLYIPSAAIATWAVKEYLDRRKKRKQN